MPHKPRMYLPDVPAHIVQRGNNRDACFFTDDCRKWTEGLLFNQSEAMVNIYSLRHLYCCFFSNPASSSAMAPSATSLLIPSLALSFLHLLKKAFLCVCSYQVIYVSCSSACCSMTTPPLSCKATFSLVANNEACFTSSQRFY